MDLEVSRFRNKMVINVLGEQKRIMKAAKEEGDYSHYQISSSIQLHDISDETIEGVVINMETQD